MKWRDTTWEWKRKFAWFPMFYKGYWIWFEHYDIRLTEYNFYYAEYVIRYPSILNNKGTST